MIERGETIMAITFDYSNALSFMQQHMQPLEE
jgi:hypothetical protein